MAVSLGCGWAFVREASISPTLIDCQPVRAMSEREIGYSVLRLFVADRPQSARSIPYSMSGEQLRQMILDSVASFTDQGLLDDATLMIVSLT
jgi:hypothetical protein